jgi:hypothetical protein
MQPRNHCARTDPSTSASRLARSTQAWACAVALTLGLVACGDDAAWGASATTHSSQWTSFSASVTEHAPKAAAEASASPHTPAVVMDVWNVGQDGVATYQTSCSAENGGTCPAPQPVSSATLGDDAFVDLKHRLAASRILAWPDVISCEEVICESEEGLATLEVDLNGNKKRVQYPLYARGLPEGLSDLSQAIKDAVQ